MTLYYYQIQTEHNIINMLSLDATSYGWPSPSGIKRAQMISLSCRLMSSDVGLTVKMKEKKD